MIDKSSLSKRVFPLLLFVFLVSMFEPVAGVPGDDPESVGDEPFRQSNWTVTIPLWIPGYRGQFAIGDVDVDGEPGDGEGGGEDSIFWRMFYPQAKLEFFFSGEVTYRRNRWRVEADIYGGQLEESINFTLTDGTLAAARIRPIMPRILAGYRAVSWQWGKNERFSLDIWPQAGIRHIYLDIQTQLLDTQVQPAATGSWTDPVVGLWAPLKLSRRWGMELAGDLGGFGVGSKFTWSLEIKAVCRLGQLISLRLGYAMLDVYIRDTVASQDFKYDVFLAGPTMGLAFNL